MSLTIPERSLFLKRTESAYILHKRWARSVGKILSYRLLELRDLVEKRLLENCCPYCRGPLVAATFCLDHKVPIVRDGRFTLKNLAVCCCACRPLKGILDSTEFKDLLAVVQMWPKPVVKNFLGRLRAGASTVGDNLPRPGSLEWFTGCDGPLPPAVIRKPAPLRPCPPSPDCETDHESHHDQPTLGDASGCRGDPI